MTALRRHLAKEPPAASSNALEQFTLPPALLSVVLPVLSDPLEGDDLKSYRFSGNSVTIALTQRAKQLQEENDELYDLLKHGETGRLKEEVRALRHVVRKMERGLTGERLFFLFLVIGLDWINHILFIIESHSIINSLS